MSDFVPIPMTPQESFANASKIGPITTTISYGSEDPMQEAQIALSKKARELGAQIILDFKTTKASKGIIFSGSAAKFTL